MVPLPEGERELLSHGPQPFLGVLWTTLIGVVWDLEPLSGGPQWGSLGPSRLNSTAREASFIAWLRSWCPGGRDSFRKLLRNSTNCLTESLLTASQVSQAVQWLVSRCPCVLDLCCQTLIQYVEDGIGREFSSRFFHDRRERRQDGLASQEPGAIIELFNSVLHFLASVVASEQLCDLSWPVTEFAEAGGSLLLPHLHWNAPEHLAWLKQAVLGFQLPQMDLPPEGGA